MSFLIRPLLLKKKKTIPLKKKIIKFSREFDLLKIYTGSWINFWKKKNFFFFLLHNSREFKYDGDEIKCVVLSTSCVCWKEEKSVVVVGRIGHRGYDWLAFLDGYFHLDFILVGDWFFIFFDVNFFFPIVKMFL